MTRAHAPAAFDLDLELSRRGTRGRPSVAVSYSVLRPIEDEDLLAQAAANKPLKLEPLQKLRERHHMLARLISAGESNIAAAAATGFTKEYVSNLICNDPSFKELVEFYRDKVEEQFFSTTAQLAGLAQDVITELRERIESDAESFDNRELRGLMTDLLDRTGFGPSRTEKKDITVNLATQLDAARQRALQARMMEAKIIDVEPDE
jgi:hypothetical protein